MVLPQEHGVSILGRQLAVEVVAFGFKHGIPLDADLVFDVRFLPNPNYVAELQLLDGGHPKVIAFLDGVTEAQSFKLELYRFVDFLLPQFVREGKAHLTIAIGCTGGRHRSVYLANDLVKHLMDKGVQAFVERRDAKA